MENFADRLLRAIDKKENLGIVGLDPDVEFIPYPIQEMCLDRFPTEYADDFRAEGASLLEFNKLIIDNVFDIVPAVKPQMAFYEIYKAPGIEAFDKTVKYAKSKGLIVIEDGKRNDVDNTAKKYSQGHLGKVKRLCRRGEERKEVSSFDLDALTVNGYIGSDCVMKFVDDCKKYGKGIFVLDKTSNPSSGELQDDILASGIKLSERMAQFIDNKWGEDTEGVEGYKSVGAVVGATYVEDAKILRKVMPKSIFLMPGYDPKVQGGRPQDVPHFVDNEGRGAIINSSRGIIAAYRKSEYSETYGEDRFYTASREEAIKMKSDITKELRNSGKSRW